MLAKLFPGLILLLTVSPLGYAGSHTSPFSAFHLETRIQLAGNTQLVARFFAKFTLVSGEDIDPPDEPTTIVFRGGASGEATLQFTLSAGCFSGSNSAWGADIDCPVSGEYIGAFGMPPVEVPARTLLSSLIRISEEPNEYDFAGNLVIFRSIAGQDLQALAALISDPTSATLSFGDDFGEVLGGRKVVPHIAIGNVWSTRLTLVHTGTDLNRIRVNFWSTGGLPLMVSATNETFSSLSVTNELLLTLLPRSATDFSIAPPPGADPSEVITGWISVTPPADAGEPLKAPTHLRHITGHGIFTNATPGAPIFEAVVPLKAPAGAAVMPFDNAGGKVSCFAIANPAADRLASLSLEFAGPTGVRFLTADLNLGSRNQFSTCLPDAYQSTTGQAGVLTIRPGQNAAGSNSPALSILGFRADVSGTFTTLFPVGPADVGGLIRPR